MKFKTVNKTSDFDFKDANITKASIADGEIALSVEALIVKASNENNTNYTDSYAAETSISFKAASIVEVTKFGYKKYDANDQLLESVEDEKVSLPDSKIKSLCQGSYLTGVVNENGQAKIYIELMDEDPSAVTDEYEIVVSCSEIVIEWDRYLNRVQNY